MSKIGYNAIGRGKLATDFRAPTNSGIRAVRAVAKSQADAQTAKLASFLIGAADGLTPEERASATLMPMFSASVFACMPNSVPSTKPLQASRIFSSARFSSQ